MKYLKDLNTFSIKLNESNDRYYQEMTRSEYFDRKRIDISESEFLKVKKDLRKELYDVKLVVYNHINEIYISYSFGFITVKKVDDDWFLVRIDNIYYKCDQIDGLMNLIEDNHKFKRKKVNDLHRKMFG